MIWTVGYISLIIVEKVHHFLGCCLVMVIPVISFVPVLGGFRVRAVVVALIEHWLAIILNIGIKIGTVIWGGWRGSRFQVESFNVLDLWGVLCRIMMATIWFCWRMIIIRGMLKYKHIVMFRPFLEYKATKEALVYKISQLSARRFVIEWIGKILARL